MMKKIVAIMLALVMVLAICATAWAGDDDGEGGSGEPATTQINNGNTSDAPTLGDGTNAEVGVAGTWTEKDTERLQNNQINIVKEILSFNATSTSVHAPVFSYVYTVTPATVAANTDVTDDATDHVANAAVKAPVQPGVTTGLKVNEGEAGSGISAVGYLNFTNTNTFTTSSSGGSNTYNILLDFSGVAFSAPGVYRYQIAETITKPDHTTAVTYNEVAMKDASGTNPDTRWLDVYVDGNKKIYGYVCMAANGAVTSSTTKTNGFVQTSNGADEYYTYDLDLSKIVENDTVGDTHEFPFTVLFNNTEKYTSTFAITDSSESENVTLAASTGDVNVAWSKVEKVKEGANITYTGIPAGVDVDVYETNDMNGVTYSVVSKVNGTESSTDANVNWTATTPSQAAAQANPKANTYESTKVTVNTTKTTAVTAKQTVEITNTLLLISPTGVVLRIAPYALILAAGIALLLISRRRKTAHEEE